MRLFRVPFEDRLLDRLKIEPLYFRVADVYESALSGFGEYEQKF